MSNVKDFIYQEMFSTSTQAMELFARSLKKGVKFDAFGNKTVFSAVVLTSPVILKHADIHTPSTPLGRRLSTRAGKFAFKARIIDDPSPHYFLPDPCDPALSDNPEKQLRRTFLHTTFIAAESYDTGMLDLPKVGDVVKVELEKNVFSYELGFGRFLSITKNNTGIPPELSAAACSQIDGSFTKGASAFLAGFVGDIEYEDSFLVSGSYEEKLARLMGSYEGLRLTAYADAIHGWDVPTIGIGATHYPPGFRLSGKVKKGDTITEDEALWIKQQHIISHRARLLKEITPEEYSKLPDGVKAALESKVFNYGSLESTLAGLVKEAVKSSDYSKVSAYFRDTLAAHNGGVNGWRRRDEAGLIDSGKSARAKIDFGTEATAMTDLGK